jgi:hypothetical protein
MMMMLWVLSESERVTCLTAEAVKGAALPLECVDDVEGCDSLALGVLGVCDSVADDALEEGLENAAGLFEDHWRRMSDAAGDV